MTGNGHDPLVDELVTTVERVLSERIGEAITSGELSEQAGTQLGRDILADLAEQFDREGGP